MFFSIQLYYFDYLCYMSLLIQGGLSKRYKMFLVENANEGESKASLFRVQGTSSRSMQAIQVNLVGPPPLLSAYVLGSLTYC